jgi:hypothetical protein
MTTHPLQEAQSNADRRDFLRRKFRGKLEVEWGAAVLSGSVRDIGPKGLFVELTPPLWIGATFRARLIVNPVLLLNCTVARVEPGLGFAVIFDFPEERGKAQLEALLTTLSQA